MGTMLQYTMLLLWFLLRWCITPLSSTPQHTMHHLSLCTTHHPSLSTTHLHHTTRSQQNPTATSTLCLTTTRRPPTTLARAQTNMVQSQVPTQLPCLMAGRSTFITQLTT